MKKLIFFLHFILLCFSNIISSRSFESCKIPCSFSKNYFLPHSFSSSSLKDLQQEKYLWNGMVDYQHQNFEISSLVEYQQNLPGKCNNCKNLGSMPFWSGTNSMTFGTNNGKADIDAYQLGLGHLPVTARGISGKIELNPNVRQIGADLMLYYVREKQKPGVYFKIHAPLVAVTIAPQLQETNYVDMFVSNSFEQTTQPSDPNNPATSTLITYYDSQYPIIEGQNFISSYFTGGTVQCDQLDGNIFKPLRLNKGRIATCSQTEIRLADLSASLGYNFVVNEKGFFGVAFKCSCPTGNVATADFMLEPIVGRGGYWGVGAEITGKGKIWENGFGSDCIDFWVQAEVLHLIPGKRPNMRSFDLKQNGPGSKYLLVQHYAPQYGRQEVDPYYFQTTMQPESLYSAVDITTLPVISKIAIEGSCAVAFDYHHEAWNITLGAEAWGRARESLSIDKPNAVALRHPNLNEFAVLGRQHASYLIDGNGQNFYTYYCEPLARINVSQNPVVLVGVPPYLESNYEFGFVQPGVVAEITAPTELPEGIADARIASNRIPEKFEDALNICGAQVSAAITGKLFGQIGYTFQNCKFTPCIAIHGTVEFAGKTNNALDVWAAGIQMGLNF